MTDKGNAKCGDAGGYGVKLTSAHHNCYST